MILASTLRTRMDHLQQLIAESAECTCTRETAQWLTRIKQARDEVFTGLLEVWNASYDDEARGEHLLIHSEELMLPVAIKLYGSH